MSQRNGKGLWNPFYGMQPGAVTFSHLCDGQSFAAQVRKLDKLFLNTTTVTAGDWLVWNYDTIRKLATEYPQILQSGFRVALYYVGTCMERHVNIMTKSAESRLAHQLIRLATSVGKVGNSGIEIDITHEQFSSLSCVDRFTTSRVLSKWEKERVLSKQGGRLTIHAPESLMPHTLGLKI